MVVCILDMNGKPLMPTKRFGKVRHLLKDGKATIVKYNPFTIKLLYDTTSYTQNIELTEDTGYLNIGMSVKSSKREYVSAEYVLLSNEKSMHDDCRSYRRTRRNRLRYRKTRFDNRKASKQKGWLAPSIKNKMDRHVDLIVKYLDVMPITSITLEVGEFDPAYMKAILAGKEPPKGIDYQQGPLYFEETLRKAVFSRDGYKCRICGKSGILDKARLHTHHALYWKGIHGDTLDQLITLCEKCHTPTNHQEGGILYGYDPMDKNGKHFVLKEATYMNIVMWQLYNKVKDICENKNSNIEVKLTYGSTTSAIRKFLELEKTHFNDAYCIGEYKPSERAIPIRYQKVRQNNRVLSKFYDAKYIDVRDGSEKYGKELSCNRTNRKIPRNNENNLRIYRGRKVKKGRYSIRTKHYAIRPHDIVTYKNVNYEVVGIQNNGNYVKLKDLKKIPSIKNISIKKHCNGWYEI